MEYRPDATALARFFAEHIDPRADSLEITPLAGGRSNLTYRVTCGERAWVLRRPPLGPVPPTAHDVAREYRILESLAATPVPVPRCVALCEDDTVIGAPFAVVEWVAGPIWRTPDDVASVSEAGRRAACEALVDVLSALHGLGGPALRLPGSPTGEGYLGRQLRRWDGQLKRWSDRDLPGVVRLGERLSRRLPETRRSGPVHGDYRFDNTIMHPVPSHGVRAVLDWELATVGDPLADVGSLLAYWYDGDFEPVFSHQELTALPGFLTADELLAEYERRAGARVEPLGFYVGLACYRWAIIREGVYARARQAGDGLSPDTRQVADSVVSIAERGLRALEVSR